MDVARCRERRSRDALYSIEEGGVSCTGLIFFVKRVCVHVYDPDPDPDRDRD